MADINEIRQKLTELRTEYEEKIKPQIENKQYDSSANSLVPHYAYFFENFSNLSLIHSGIGFFSSLESLLNNLRQIDSIDKSERDEFQGMLDNNTLWFEAYLIQTQLPLRED